MARGWESKSVEDQMADAETRRRPVRRGPEPSPEERARAREVDAVSLARARVLEQLQTTCDRRYRASLEQALADLDARLAGLTGRL